MPRTLARVGVLFAVVVVLFALTTSAQGARNSEQVIFSGAGTFPGVSDFGFWIWCEADSQNRPHPSIARSYGRQGFSHARRYDVRRTRL